MSEAPQQTTQSPPVEADPERTNSPTADSALGITGGSSYASSLLSEARNYRYENGRRYHSYREGQYVLPNDETEQDRQDLVHHIRGLVFRGKLYHAPLKENISRVFDIGTGTGIWAMDFADEFPSATVVGTDLSPIQPSWVPPNVEFFVDDAESEWTFKKESFDFIRAVDLGGSIADWPKLLKQAYAHLKPGGWIELSDFPMHIYSDNGDPEKQAPAVVNFFKMLREASTRFNRPMDVAEDHINKIKAAGFVDVEEKIYKFPASAWSSDPVLKDAGRYNHEANSMGLDSYGTALFTRVLGWDPVEVVVFLASVRNQLRDPQYHLYVNGHVVWGRKPESA
ncbi:hypothetical protein ASPZODRAFT_168718 [Penicilliopsis zonata CBS 506.65]|uniref:Methyltransferase domain-containing protein n=1 Tax=Penicilliopsis zonata CBS 506.65 TaxID=1073090 RepID=A0A1L9SBB9_9EURO|nr:hypothetical protein ASPZODRAFT_168718 [Penicilliopsis zonata CBS 506.65]OJJ44448.1 hypothetical protein ASPZODRAFT_168718 [Penicilliopsis zonata CBS 506.65]